MNIKNLDRTVGAKAVNYAIFSIAFLMLIAAAFGKIMASTKVPSLLTGEPDFLFPFIRQHYDFLVSKGDDANYVFVISALFQFGFLIGFATFLIRLIVMFAILSRTGRCDHRLYDFVHQGGARAKFTVFMILIPMLLAFPSVFENPSTYTEYFHDGSAAGIHSPLSYFFPKAIFLILLFFFSPSMILATIYHFRKPATSAVPADSHMDAGSRRGENG